MGDKPTVTAKKANGTRGKFSSFISLLNGIIAIELDYPNERKVTAGQVLFLSNSPNNSRVSRIIRSERCRFFLIN
jgi:hypothetical protein